MSSTSSTPWQHHISKETGKPYWFNTSTGVSTYTNPFLALAKRRLPPPPPTGSRPAGWKQALVSSDASSQAWLDSVEAAAFEAAMDEAEGREEERGCKDWLQFLRHHS